MPNGWYRYDRRWGWRRRFIRTGCTALDRRCRRLRAPWYLWHKLINVFIVHGEGLCWFFLFHDFNWCSFPLHSGLPRRRFRLAAALALAAAVNGSSRIRCGSPGRRCGHRRGTRAVALPNYLPFVRTTTSARRPPQMRRNHFARGGADVIRPEEPRWLRSLKSTCVAAVSWLRPRECAENECERTEPNDWDQ